MNLFVKSTAILFLTLGLWVSNSWSQTEYEYEYVEEEVEEAPAAGVAAPVAKAPRAPRPNVMADDYKLGLGVNVMGGNNWTLIYKISPILKTELSIDYHSTETVTTPAAPAPATTVTASDMVIGLFGYYLMPFESLTGELGGGVLYHSTSVDNGAGAVDASDLTFVVNFGTEYFFTKQFSATGRLQLHYFSKTQDADAATFVPQVDDTNIDTQTKMMFNWYFL